MSSGVRTLEAFAMIRLYCAEGGELRTVDSPRLKDALWIDAVAPTPEEVEMLHKELDIDLQDVADCLDPNERSRVEIEETYDLLVLRSILSEERNGDRIQTMPIGIFVTKGKVITVRIGSSFTYQELTSELKHKPRIDVKEDLFLALVRKVNKDIEKKVRPLERTIASIQEKILTAKRGEVAPQAFALSNGLILLNTALLSNLNAISMLSRAKHLRLTKEKLDIAEDLENDVAQLYEMTTIYREIMSNVLNAYESTLANSLSTVMKTLTTISLILILPMMIAGWFSMNVALPFDKDAYWSFWLVVGVSVAAVAGLWAFFRLKGIL
jgi:magnesium transporter